MDYRDNIKNMLELNDAHNSMRSTMQAFEEITKLSPTLLSASERIKEQVSKFADLVQPLMEIKSFQDNNIKNLISEISPIIANVQLLLPNPQGLLDALNNTYLSETIKSMAAFPLTIDNIANSLMQTDILEKTIWEYEQTAGVESTTSSEEITELHNDLKDIAVDNKNWQQRLAEKAGKWKEKNPVICFFIVQVLLPLLLSILASFIFAKVTAPKAAIKEEPSATGTVIYNITINQDVTIIDDTRYYYKVEYYSKETNETIIGWISKRSIEVNSNDSFDE